MRAPLAAVLAVDRRVRGEPALFALLLVQAVLLARFAPNLLQQDTWLTLVVGRALWESGLPASDSLAIYTAGRPWIDQQWLAQLVFHAAGSLGGVPLVFVTHLTAFVGAVGIALASARRRGAASGGLATVALLAMFVAPWAWQPRAQSLAYPLFVGVVALLLADRREGRTRTLAVIPLLILWANLHGSVLIGVGVATAYAILTLASRRNQRGKFTALALLASPLALLATPYGLTIVGYYVSIVGNGDLPALAAEWRRPAGGYAILFLLLAALSVALPIARRRRVTPFEVVLFAGTFGASLTAMRHFIWFALAMTAVLPPLVRTAPATVPAPAVRWLARACAACVGLVGLALLIQPTSWYVAAWPEPAAAALSATAREEPGATIFVHGRESDWLMWRDRALEGRIAYDARLELLSPDEIRRLVEFDRREGGRWDAAADGFDLVWISNRLRPEHAEALRALGRFSVVYRDAEVTLLRRRGST